MRKLMVIGTASVVSLSACGIDAVGLAPIAGDPTDGSVSDDRGPSDGNGSDGGTSDGGIPDDGGPPTCVTVPAEWRLVGVTTNGAACPGGATARTYLEGPDVGTTPCTCSCGAPSSNPCEAPMKTVHQFKAATGGSCTVNATIQTNGGCTAGQLTVTGVTAFSSMPLPPESVACPATATKPAIAATSRIDACETEGATCVPAGQRACISHAGEIATCPAGFDVRTVVTELADVDDQRTCAACTCNSSATSCTNATLTLYTDEMCTTGARVAKFDGTCAPFDSTGYTPKAAFYRATPTPAGCAPATPTSALSGTVASKAKTTICCSP